MAQRTAALLAFLSLVSVASAQSALDPALAAWRAEHGPAWQVVVEPASGLARFLYGGRGPAPARAPREDAELVALAREALAQTRALHGVDPATLAPSRVVFLPLGAIGSGDKATVRFVQSAGGVPVEGGTVDVLLDASGALRSVHSNAVAGELGDPPAPALSPAEARALAVRAFTALEAAAPTLVGAPQLVLARELRGGAARLAWKVELRADVAGAQPAGWRLSIDAADGRLLARERTVHSFQVSGTVTTLATPGTTPDSAANPEVAQPLAYAEVTSSAGTTTTDATGFFSFPAVATALDVTIAYRGTWNDVADASGPPYALTQQLLPGAPAQVLLNPAAVDGVTAQANAFQAVHRVRDWIRSINPSDTAADFVARAYVNIAQTCNAYYDGVSINFFAAGGPCVNTSFSTVVAHEEGHWLNDRYATTNGPDGMGEGNADVFAMYAYDTPIVGEGFTTAGGYVRSGLNTRAFCGDQNLACYGQVHADGEPWMGAAWKVRARLNATHGNALGDLIADNLFLAWMNSYDQRYIESVIEPQWLTLDDDNGNLLDGTPHRADIDAGFRDQGFPGWLAPVITFANVTDVADSECEASLYPVAATITPVVAGSIASATLRWRTGAAGPFATLAMTSGGGSTWTGSLPALTSPAWCEYWIEALDSAGNVRTFPAEGAAKPLSFSVGALVSQLVEGFETPGQWTHGWAGGSPNQNDDWQNGAPAGLGGNAFGVPWADPAAPAGGQGCWGNDLGPAGFNGAYQSGVHNRLVSPPIPFAGSVGTRLRFARWLTVEEALFDKARVYAGGVEVWQNPIFGNTLDGAWTNVELDLAAAVDGKPAAEIVFSLRSDGGLELGGWNVDDLEIVGRASAPSCCPPPATMCATTPNSAGAGAVLSASGSTGVAQNALAFQVAGGPPNRFGMVVYGRAVQTAAFGNGTLCVAAPTFKLGVFAFDAAGTAQLALDHGHLPAGGAIQPGEDWYFQSVYRDPSAGGALFDASSSLHVRFCP